ncbi:hypothetical protein HAX54_043049, partial [Datura stramonium]|nr:hypothetical protein [Datura stramonium]
IETEMVAMQELLGGRREWTRTQAAAIMRPPSRWLLFQNKGNMEFLEPGILPGYVRCSDCYTAIVDSLQWYIFRCSESATVRQSLLQ